MDEWREGRREGGKEGGREGGREGGTYLDTVELLGPGLVQAFHLQGGREGGGREGERKGGKPMRRNILSEESGEDI